MPKGIQENTPVRGSSTLNNTFTFSNNINTIRGSQRFKAANFLETPEPLITQAQDHIDISTLFTDIRELKKSLQETNLQLITVTKTLARYENLDKCLKARDDEKAELRETVAQMQDVIDHQAQLEVRNEVEIIGLPETTNENLHHVALTLASKIQINLKDEDIDEVYRAGARRNLKINDQPRPIVIRLVRHSKRKELLKASKQRKNLTSADLTDGQNIPIYLNERLTRKNRLLFRKTRKEFYEAGFRYCWTNEGHIFVRKEPNLPAIKINNEQDIAHFLQKQVVSEGSVVA